MSCTRGGNAYYVAPEPKHGPDEAWSNMTKRGGDDRPQRSRRADRRHFGCELVRRAHARASADARADARIAERWDISDDGLRYVFHLRESTWSDGLPLTAADFVYTWRRVLDPKTGSRYASFLFGIEHGELFDPRALRVRGTAGASEAELRDLIEPLASIEQLSLDPSLREPESAYDS